MAPQKLSDSDKQAVLDLYRHSDETSSTLAARYGVSNTTISRILKQGLSEDEYEALIQRKRIAGRTPAPAAIASPPISTAPVLPIATPTLEPEPELSAVESDQPSIELSPADKPLRRRRSSAVEEPISTVAIAADRSAEVAEVAEVAEAAEAAPVPVEPKPKKRILDPVSVSAPVPVPVPVPAPNLSVPPVDEEDEDEDEDDLDDLDDDLDDDLEDEDDEDDEDDGLAAMQVHSKSFIQVLPLSEAAMPKTCYLVVDRASELITRPLRDFAELGQIPTEEVQAKTLPIFDNHRVARRFSRRMQRVVKVPDSQVITKVSSYLQAKGITRLLIDGQVYSLSEEV